MAVIYDKEYFESPEGLHNKGVRACERLDIVMNLLAPKSQESMLDIGCGYGRFADLVAEFGIRYVGIDISEYVIEQAKKRQVDRERFHFECMSCLNMNYKDQFDKVLCYHVVEHLVLQDARILLRNIFNSLKPGGALVIGCPIDDACLPRRLLHYAANRRKWRYCGHLLSFSKDRILKELRLAGFCITDVCLLSYFGIILHSWFPQIPLVGLPVTCITIRAIKV